MKVNKIKTIRKEAIDSLYHDTRDKKLIPKYAFIIVYYVFPFVISIILVVLKLFLNEDSITYFITGISIFAGLFFNLLIVVSDKMDKRKKLLFSKYEPTSNYAQDYKKFSERLIASISYSIFISIILIGIMFLTQLKYEKLLVFCSSNCVNKITNISNYFFNFLSYFLGYQLIIFLIHILTEIYDMLIHDMNTTEYQNEEQ